MKPSLSVRRQAFLNKYFTGDSIDYQQIIALYVPILIDQAFLVGLNLVNIAMISSSGVAAVSAVSMIDSLNNFLISVFVAVSTGGTVVVAQYKGSGNDRMVSRAAASSVSLVTISALVISLLMIMFHSPVLTILFGTASPEVFANAKIYLIGSSVSYVGIAIVEAVCGALRGIGKSRSSLKLSLIMNVSYVILNVICINFLHMGVHGLSISVNVSRYAAAIIAILYLVKLDTNLRLQLKDLIQINVAMFKKDFIYRTPLCRGTDVL